MLRTRMFTPGFKLFFGLFGFLLVSALVFGLSTELQTPGASVRDNLDKQGLIATFTGPLTVGWKGAVGNHLGYGVLLAGGMAAAFLAFVLIAFRDVDPEAAAELIQAESVPLTKAPTGANYAPIIGAFGLALLAVGWVTSEWLFLAGVGLIVLSLGAWTVRAWAERATGDDEVNFQIYHRLIDPLRVPVLAVLGIAFVVLGLSRLLLAVPDKTTSSIIFGGAGIVFFLAVLGIALAPKFSKAAAIILLAIGAVAVLGAGVYGIAKGARPVEHHSVEGAGHGGSTEGGVAPAGQTEGKTTPAAEGGAK
jgi:hypothetical protein